MIKRAVSLFLALMFIGSLMLPVMAAATEYKVSQMPVGTFGGQLVVSQITDPKTFNPVTAAETSSTDILGPIFEGLTSTDGVTTAVIPSLAKSWKFSEDGLVWTFYLRQGVKFSDGKEMTADDVVFSFDVIYDKNIQTSSRDVLTIDGQYLKYKKIDAYTVEFTLPSTFAPLLRQIMIEIIPKHKLEAPWKAGKFNETWGINTPVRDIIGTGMYVMSTYKPNEYVVYTRNTNYWVKNSKGEVLPYITRYVRMLVPNLETQTLKFRAGETDILGIKNTDYASFKDLQKKENFTLYNLGATFSTEFVVFNMNSRNPNFAKDKEPWKLEWFTNQYFRKGVAHLVDKTTIINQVYAGLAEPQWSPVSAPNKEFLSTKVTQYAYSLDKAKEMFLAGGFKYVDGKLVDKTGRQVKFEVTTHSENSNRMKIANILVEDLKKAGIDAKATTYTFNTLVEKLMDTFEFDTIIIGLTGSVEPNNGRNVWHSSGGLHMWNPVQEKPATAWEAEIDKIFDDGVKVVDPAKRAAIYEKWQLIVSDQVPLIYFAAPQSIAAMRNTLANVKPTAYGGTIHNLEEIYYIKP